MKGNSFAHDAFILSLALVLEKRKDELKKDIVKMAAAFMAMMFISIPLRGMIDVRIIPTNLLCCALLFVPLEINRIMDHGLIKGGLFFLIYWGVIFWLGNCTSGFALMLLLAVQFLLISKQIYDIFHFIH